MGRLRLGTTVARAPQARPAWDLRQRGALPPVRYLDEHRFTYNQRGLGDYGRFEAVMHAVFGLRLTYAEVTGQR